MADSGESLVWVVFSGELYYLVVEAIGSAVNDEKSFFDQVHL